jgi:transcription antitermination factor NusG
MPTCPHPAFSIFRYGGRIPLVNDGDIANLHSVEDHARQRLERARLKQHRQVFPVGSPVKLQHGAFAGMSGVVQGGDGKYAVVAFNRSLSVKIATFLLSPDDVEQKEPNLGTAAKAA